MASFGDALRAVNALKDERVIETYAIAGAMALVFWTEPVPTYDLDVLVVLPASGGPHRHCRTARLRGNPGSRGQA